MVGASRDKPGASERMATQLELPFPLLSDADGSLVEAYGVRGMLGMAQRVTFVVDADGEILRSYPKVSPAGHARDVLSDLEAGD